jgi:hypothetical protein
MRSLIDDDGKSLPSYEAIADKFFYAPNVSRENPNKNFRGMLFMMPNTSEIDFEEPVTSEALRDIGKYLVYMKGNGTFEMDGTGNFLLDRKGRALTVGTPLDWMPEALNPRLKNESTIDIWKMWPEIPSKLKVNEIQNAE